MAQQYTNLKMHIASRNTAVPSVNYFFRMKKIIVITGQVLVDTHKSLFIREDQLSAS